MVKPYFEHDGIVLYCGRCEEILPQLETASVSLIATDPPYYRMKDEWWDKQWDTAAGYLSWLGCLCEEWRRVLTLNGSLYCFASPDMAARVEVRIGEFFHVLNRITWAKEAGWQHKADKEALRSYFPASEAIIFAEQQNADSVAMNEAGFEAKCDELRGSVFEPIRAYLESERVRAGVERKACDVACGVATMASRHYFCTSQWQLPTAEHYAALQRLFNAGGVAEFLRKDYEFLRKDYEFLRKDYEELRKDYEELRRPFFGSADAEYTDVWNTPTVAFRKGKHPCEKRQTMMEHIIRTSSRPGDVVLDAFAGSGTTLAAARFLGRKAIGIEVDEDLCCRIVQRLSQHCLDMER